MKSSEKPSTKKYDEEDVVSIIHEMNWRDEHIKELEEVLHHNRLHQASKNKPRNYRKIFGWSFVLFIVSGLPVFAYGRNAWQMTAYYINKALWMSKGWWY